MTYVRARSWLMRLSFPAAVEAARAAEASGLVPQLQMTAAAVRLGSAVERILRQLPVDSRCLVKALVLTRLLARRGIDCTFVLGVRVQPTFAAHAWVEREGVPLLPTSAEFQPLIET